MSVSGRHVGLQPHLQHYSKQTCTTTHLVTSQVAIKEKHMQYHHQVRAVNSHFASWVIRDHLLQLAIARVVLNVVSVAGSRAKGDRPV